MTAPSTGRRALLGAAALAPLAALPAVAQAALPDAGDDAELVRLGAEYRRYQQEYKVLDRRWRDVMPEPASVRAEIRELVELMHDVAEEIADLHASTMAGLRVKAAVLIDYMNYTSDLEPLWTNHDELLGWSIARDLLGDAAARPAGDDA